MGPRMTKFLALFLPFAIGSLHQPDIAALLAPHPIESYLVGGVVTLVAAYLGIGLSGPTAAPKMAAALGNPGAAPAPAKLDDPPPGPKAA